MIINKNKNPLFMISFLRNIYEEFKEEQPIKSVTR